MYSWCLPYSKQNLCNIEYPLVHKFFEETPKKLKIQQEPDQCWWKSKEDAQQFYIWFSKLQKKSIYELTRHQSLK